MASITLKDGDFGAGIEIVVNENEFILPDLARPGLREALPFTAVAGMDAIEEDRSAQYRDAVRLGLKGLSAAGPVGLAASVLAIRKPKSVVFEVRLKDGRTFVATADAATYATVRGFYFAAHRRPAGKSETPEDRAADAIVARYIAKKPESGARTAPPSTGGATRVPESSPGAIEGPVFGRRRS